MISSSMCTLIAVRLLFLLSMHIHLTCGSSITSVTNVSIECKSERYGVVFTFQEQKSSDYIRVAECQFGSGGNSQLMDDKFKGTYDVTYVKYTCILTILYLTVKQCGTYIFLEMYNDSETVEKQIVWTCEDATGFTATANSDRTQVIVVLSVGCVILVVVSIAFGVHFHLRQKENQTTSTSIIRRQVATNVDTGISNRSSPEPIAGNQTDTGTTLTGIERPNNETDNEQSVETESLIQNKITNDEFDTGSESNGNPSLSSKLDLDETDTGVIEGDYLNKEKKEVNNEQTAGTPFANHADINNQGSDATNAPTQRMDNKSPSGSACGQDYVKSQIEKFNKIPTES